MLSASRSGSPVRRAVPEIGQVSTRCAFDPHEHLRRRADQLLVAELQQELVRTRAGMLHPLEQLRRPSRSKACGTSAAAPPRSSRPAHAFAHRLDLRHVLLRRVIAGDRTGARAGVGGATAGASARQSTRSRSLALEIVLVALDLLLLAIHEIDVVAEKEMQILVAVPRQLQLDRIELEQQIVSERADQREPRILLRREIPRSERAESKTPTAACCVPLRGTTRAAASAGRAASRLRTRIRPNADDRASSREQHRGNCDPTGIQRPEFHPARRKRSPGEDTPRPCPSANTAPDTHIPTRDRCRGAVQVIEEVLQALPESVFEAERVTWIPWGVV